MDIDKIQEKRVDKLWKSWHDDGNLEISDVFLSAQVLELVDEQKIAFESFNVEQILSVIPFSNTVFVLICPACIDSDNFEVFEGLVNAGLIVPVFQARYRYYPPEVVQAVATKPHISVYEFEIFRTAILHSRSEAAVCSHCVEEREVQLDRLIRGKRNAPQFRDHLETVVRNIRPFVDPDFEILDELEESFSSRSLDRAQQIADTSFGIQTLRNAQALNAPLLLTDEKLDHLNRYELEELEELRRVGLELRELISHGLGLKVPTTMPIGDYVGLVRDIRPHMLSITTKMLESGRSSTNEISLRDVFNGIEDVNREVERILRSKRYLFMEAAVSTVSNNKELLASALVAAARVPAKKWTPASHVN
ncbi:hypothetical protein [Azoarcus sp. DD4]|uniref:hypothetical protein n=1 Tax=Azoarcus sp. DD4 TaxID=2027405 RepID=UPI00112B4778|nr:hypothetical protein [Azoarcus sp. DD4]